MSTRSGISRKFIHSQVYLSHLFDSILPAQYRVDGSADFRTSFARKYLANNLIVYDVGGGKNPLLSMALKRQFALTVIGLDIDQHELRQAPNGLYDATICADITHYQGKTDADLVVCHALLEHVENIEAALTGIASILKPGGVAVIFVPSKNALYARLNLLLPEKLKTSLLHAIFPQTLYSQGFVSYYDRCTPRDIVSLAKRHGLNMKSKRLYFLSSYFSFFFPLYMLWRIWGLLFHGLAGEQAAEAFSMAFQKEFSGQRSKYPVYREK